MNKHLMNKINNMDPEALYMAIYQDSLTGVLNRTAFTEFSTVYGINAIALIDLGSLKYINDYHPDYHRAGDRMIQKLGEILVLEFGENNVFRMGGDEFAVIGMSEDKITQGLAELSGKYPIFSCGIGATLSEADSDMMIDKMCRNSEGKRAGRGERPTWFKQIDGWV